MGRGAVEAAEEEMLQPSVGTCQVEQESPVYMLLVCLEQLSDAPLCCCKPSPRCHSTSLPWPTRPAALALAASLRPWALSPSLTVFQTHLGAKHVPASDPLHLPSPLSGKLSLSYPQGVSPSLHRGFLVRSCPLLCECPVDISTPSSQSAVLFPSVLHCT